ncbi:MAG: hypothetical protein DHS20C15_17300 [Planctomycetota bacterium]|nr:MAG: hypothetical protein DHS20C15_17300 [Planctomycetota bacterium]
MWGSLGLVALVALSVWLWGPGAKDEPAAVEVLQRSSGNEPQRVLPESSAPPPEELSLPVGPPVGTAPQQARAGAVELSPALLADLIAALEREYAADSRSYYQHAPDLLLEHLESVGGDRDALATELAADLDTILRPGPIRGALIALWGALAPSEELLPLSDWGIEERRGVWLGLTAAWPATDPEGVGATSVGLRLALSEFLAFAGRPEPTPALQFVLQRPPSQELEEVLFAALLKTADDFEGIMDRYLAALSLGTALDLREHVLSTFLQLLFDDSQFGRQVRYPVLFVLSRSESATALSALQRYLREAPSGDPGADAARMWMAEKGAAGLDVRELLEPLSSSSGPMEKFFAVGACTKWLTAMAEEQGGVPAADMLFAQEQLALTLETATDSDLRTVAVGALVIFMDDGYARMDSLRGVLEGDDSPFLRRMAVDGLAGTSGALGAESRALLQAWVSQEQDAELASYIEAKLEN